MNIEDTKDYIGEDGLLYCGVCNKAKEMIWPESLCIDGKRNHRIHCLCETRELEEQRRQYEERERQHRIEEKKRRCFGNREFYKYTFENSTQEGRNVEICKKYVTDWKDNFKDNIGLLLYGNVGTGKTYLAAAIANAVIEKYECSVRMINLGDVMMHSFERLEALMEELSHCELLIVDDFGMERTTEYAQEITFNVIDKRMSSGRPMIITTNLSLKTLNNPEDINHYRIYDRVKGNCLPVQFVGESLRKENAITKRNLWKERE